MWFLSGYAVSKDCLQFIAVKSLLPNLSIFSIWTSFHENTSARAEIPYIVWLSTQAVASQWISSKLKNFTPFNTPPSPPSQVL